MKLLINIFFVITFLYSCTLNKNNKIVTTLIEKKDNLSEKIEKNKTKKENIKKNKTKKENIQDINIRKFNNNIPFYLIGEPFFIEGVEYTPKENFNYNEKGLATYYGKELHNQKTANNDFNKVTELLGRHKTLPLPSVVKLTNLENGLSLIIKINDRNENNASFIEVSRKVAQLLRFYKSGFARVQVEIMSDPSKQLKIVTEAMNDPNFDSTIDSSPTVDVIISDLGETANNNEQSVNNIEQPIELGFEQVSQNDLFVKIDGFESYKKAQSIILLLEKNYKTTTQKEDSSYSLILGPLNNNEANKLVLFFISKGYKNANILIE